MKWGVWSAFQTHQLTFPTSDPQIHLFLRSGRSSLGAYLRRESTEQAAPLFAESVGSKELLMTAPVSGWDFTRDCQKCCAVDAQKIHFT